MIWCYEHLFDSVQYAKLLEFLRYKLRAIIGFNHLGYGQVSHTDYRGVGIVPFSLSMHVIGYEKRDHVARKRTF